MKNFDKFVERLLLYKSEFGHCAVLSHYQTKDGYWLGFKVKYVREHKDNLSEYELNALEKIGFEWVSRFKKRSFDEIYPALEAYVEEFGNCNVKGDYVTQNGIKLGMYVKEFRDGRFKTSEEQKEMLNKLGFDWQKHRTRLTFDELYELIKEYTKKYGNCCIPRYYKTIDGITLGIYVNNMRHGYRKTSDEQKQLLDDLGFVWSFKKIA